MEITKVKFTKIDSDATATVRAVATIDIDNAITIHGIKIVKGKNQNLFVAMPNYHTKDKKYVDIVHPINSEARKQLDEAVLDAFKKALSEELFKSTKTVDLISVYEELVADNSEPHITEYFGDLSVHGFKDNVSTEQIQKSYDKALEVLGMTSEEFQSNTDFSSRKNIIDAFRNSDRTVSTNMGAIPVNDYREYIASTAGYDSYEEFYNSGLRIGNGFDLKPEKQAPISNKRTSEVPIR